MWPQQELTASQSRACSQGLWHDVGWMCRSGLKAELGAFYPLLLLRPLEAERPELGQLYSALNALQELATQPQLLVCAAVLYTRHMLFLYNVCWTAHMWLRSWAGKSDVHRGFVTGLKLPPALLEAVGTHKYSSSRRRDSNGH